MCQLCNLAALAKHRSSLGIQAQPLSNWGSLGNQEPSRGSQTNIPSPLPIRSGSAARISQKPSFTQANNIEESAP